PMPQRKLARAIRAYGIISPILGSRGGAPCILSDPFNPSPALRLVISREVFLVGKQKTIPIYRFANVVGQQTLRNCKSNPCASQHSAIHQQHAWTKTHVGFS